MDHLTLVASVLEKPSKIDDHRSAAACPALRSQINSLSSAAAGPALHCLAPRQQGRRVAKYMFPWHASASPHKLLLGYATAYTELCCTGGSHQPSILRRPKMDPDSALRPSPWMTPCLSDSICARTICFRWLLALQRPSMSYAQRSVLPGSALIIT